MERRLIVRRDITGAIITIRYKKVKFKISRALPKVVKFIIRLSKCMEIMLDIIMGLVLAWLPRLVS